MNRKYQAVFLLSLAAALFAGCSNGTKNDTPALNPPAAEKEENKNTETSSQEEENKDDDIELADLTPALENEIDLSSTAGGIVIQSGGTYTLQGKGTGPVVVDAKGEEVTLRLNSAQIETQDGPTVYIRKAGQLNLEFEGENTLVSNAHTQYEALNAAFYSRADLNVNGEGTLKITDTAAHALKGTDSLVLSKGRLILDAGLNGIHASDSLRSLAPSIQIESGDEGIQANEDIAIEQGTYAIHSAGDGIRSETSLDISGGDFTIVTKKEGLESKGDLQISGGTISIHSYDDGINAASSLTISQGVVDIISENNDGIDSNGALALSGGEISVCALRQPEGAFDTDNTPFVISGGTIAGVSASAAIPGEVSQNTVMIATGQNYSLAELVQDGRTIVSYSVPEGQNPQGSSILMSSPDLQSSKTAQLKLDGEIVEEFEVSQGLTTVGNIPSMQGPAGQRGGNPGRANERPAFEEDGSRPEMDRQRPPEGPDGQPPESLPENGKPSDRSDEDSISSASGDLQPLQ